MATVLQALDLTIATIALPAVERGIGVGEGAGAWILTSYIVAMALATPSAGALSATLGRRNALLLAIGGLTIASVGCAETSSLAGLLTARVVQGVAAGLIMPLVQTTLLDSTAPTNHGRAMSFFGASAMLGPVLGPSAGGALVDAFGWRSIFLINVPVGILVFVGTACGMKAQPKKPGKPIDFRGLTIFGIGIIALQLLLERGKLAGSSLEENVAYTILAVFGVGWSVLRASRSTNAFPSLAPFSDRNFAAAATGSFLSGFIVIATIFLVPSMLQLVFGQGSISAGLAIAPRGIGTLVMMLSLNRVVGRIDHRILLLTGAGLTGTAMLGLAMVDQSWGLPAVAGWSLLQGLGVGLIFTPLSTAAFSSLPGELRGDATGIYVLLRNLGGGIGVAVATILLVESSEASDALTGYHLNYLLLLAASTAMVIAFIFIRTDTPHSSGLLPETQKLTRSIRH